MSTTRRRKGAPEPDLRVVYAEVALRATARDYAATCDLCAEARAANHREKLERTESELARLREVQSKHAAIAEAGS